MSKSKSIYIFKLTFIFLAVVLAGGENNPKVLVLTDETEAEQIEMKHELKTNFFLNLAHETKTPLTLISNYLDKYIEYARMNRELGVVRENIDKLLRDMLNELPGFRKTGERTVILSA